ncbi:cobyrinate a,c-diamide synthase [Desulfurivibrio sp. D14AmB]|uniref:cobyrinate a,c-diamide synthase n=1 Tax=Desulfurivibrio sp. D14AmB TaxID=3374370 RepID=UPI00376EEFA2
MSEGGGRGGLVVAGMGGGTGKSVVAVGLVAALVGRGEAVAVFKKGPDYIDAGWLALAAGRPCYNLDPFLMTPEVIRRSFADHRRAADLALLEGNRGLYDGVDLEGSCSSAELARLLGLPVLLVVDCTKTTRTVAAQVLGCLRFDQAPNLLGVVLNRVGGARHEDIVRRSVEHYTGLPVLGALPRSRRDFFPQRHLGVTPAAEHGSAAAAVAALAEQAEKYLAIDEIVRAAQAAAPAGPVVAAAPPPAPPVIGTEQRRARIGYLHDAAFQFYYPDNLEALAAAGADLVAINALRDRELPELDALYIGGGFPETSAPALAANHSFRESVRQAANAGLPIYAECGGLIYLGESIALEGVEYPLAGVFPVRFGLARKPQAHGYTELLVEKENPFYSVGSVIRGHEFRYSTVESWPGAAAELVLAMGRGTGFSHGRDGLCFNNVLALYTHIHALGTPEWAVALVRRALEER